MPRASCIGLVGCAAVVVVAVAAALALVVSSARMAHRLDAAASDPGARVAQVRAAIGNRELPASWSPLFAAPLPLLGEAVALADRSPEEEVATGRAPERWAIWLHAGGWIGGSRDAASVERELLRLVELRDEDPAARSLGRARFTEGRATVRATVRRERLSRRGRELDARVTLARVSCPGESRPRRTLLLVEREHRDPPLPAPRTALAELLPLFGPCR